MIRNDPRALVNSRNRMLDRLGEKMDRIVGHRGDMHIADFKPIDQNGGHLLIGYAQHIGPVTSNDVTSFVAKAFDGHLAPVMETAKQHSSEGCVSLLVARHIPTRKIEDKERMLCVASTVFLDQEMGDTWTVKANPDGSHYLARVMKDSIGDIVAERRRRMEVHASTVTFGSKLSAGVPNLNVGDEVQFMSDGQVMAGNVTGIGADVNIKTANGIFTVAPEAVVQITRVSPDTQKQVQDSLQSYFSDAFGSEDYSKELTQDLSVQKSEDGNYA